MSEFKQQYLLNPDILFKFSRFFRNYRRMNVKSYTFQNLHFPDMVYRECLYSSIVSNELLNEVLAVQSSANLMLTIGLLLLRKCAEHDLLITNTVLKLPNRNKTSWMHPRSKHWHLIDYFIVRRTDRQDVRVTKTICGSDCWTDHRLVVSKLKLRIHPAWRPQGKKAPMRLDVSKLNHDSMRQAFINDISNQLGAMNLSSWTAWMRILIRLDLYQKVSVGSGKIEGQ